MPILSARAGASASAYGWGSLSEPPSSFESIATQTASSTTAALTFSSIPSTFTHLQVRGIFRGTDTGYSDNVTIRFNADTGFNYNSQGIATDNASVTVYGPASTDGMSSTAMGSISAGAPTNLFGAYVIDILDYASTSKYKTIMCFSGWDSNLYGKSALSYGIWKSTAAINSITIKFTNGSVAAGSTFALYGMKASA